MHLALAPPLGRKRQDLRDQKKAEKESSTHHTPLCLTTRGFKCLAYLGTLNRTGRIIVGLRFRAPSEPTRGHRFGAVGGVVCAVLVFGHVEADLTVGPARPIAFGSGRIAVFQFVLSSANSTWGEGANCRSAARADRLLLGHHPPPAGIIAVIWSWRKGIYSNDFPEFRCADVGDWRQRHSPAGP